MTRFALAAFAALSSAAVPASASTIHIRGDRAYVDYQDLNLASPQGRDALIHRIKSAAEAVCNPEEFNGFSHSDPKCVRLAVASGVAQMDAVLTASSRG